MEQSQKKILLYSGIGGLLEFYDFIIYALMASVLAELFFPATNTIASLLETFTAFSLGYFVRPIGGVIFSHFGDKYGRKKIFTSTVILMAISTFAIGCVPPFHIIGVASTLLLIVFRLLQGMSVGGEIPGAITYISETIPKKHEIATAVIFFFILNGITLGVFLAALLTTKLSHLQLVEWGWRCLFIFGGIIGFIGFYFRKKMT